MFTSLIEDHVDAWSASVKYHDYFLSYLTFFVDKNVLFGSLITVVPLIIAFWFQSAYKILPVEQRAFINDSGTNKTPHCSQA